MLCPRFVDIGRDNERSGPWFYEHLFRSFRNQEAGSISTSLLVHRASTLNKPSFLTVAVSLKSRRPG